MSKFTRKLTSSVAPIVNTPGVFTVNERTQNSTALVITSIVVCDASYNELDDTAVGTTGGYLKIKGTGFLSTATVYLNGVLITPTVTSSLELRIVVPTLTVGTYSLIVFNTAAVGAIYAAGLVVSGFPVWSTTTIATANLSVSTQLVATGDATLVYTLASGSLPPGVTLSSSGLLSGTISPVPSVNTVYNFTVDVKDAQNQNLAQAITFSLTVDYLIAKSLRFRSSASAYLNRTPATATNRTTWTISVWYKAGGIETGAVNANILNAGGDGSSVLIGGAGAFGATYNSRLLYREAGVTLLYWPMVFRDPAAWYHIVFVMDTTQATAANRTKLYVNGVDQGTFTGTAVTQNSNTSVNSASAHYINAFNGAFYQSDLEYAEYNFVDGQALAPTAFGAYSIYNQWLPIRYTGTYGTNGFYLPFNSVSTSSFAGSFNGSTQYLTVSLAGSSCAFGSGDFTAEAWIYTTSVSGNQTVYDSYPLATGGSYPAIYVAIGGALLYNTNVGTQITGATLSVNTWYHVAVARSGTSTKMFLNGAQTGSTYTDTNTYLNGTGRPYIGGSGYNNSSLFVGYISNLRLVKGTAVYTANFVPPTAALTAITNTSLLTLQSATIIDNSTNAFTITNVGTVVTSVQYPFTLAIAADSSGNANNWTPNNISLTAGSTYDSLTDVPTLTSTTAANYAVLNPLDKGVTVTMSSGNLKMVQSGVGTDCFRASMALPATGKWYWEIKVTAIGSGGNLGVATQSSSLAAGSSLTGILSQYTGFYAVNGWSSSGSYTAWTTNDLMAVAVDSGTGIVTFYKNGASLGAIPTALTASQTYFPFGQGTNSTYDFNFGQQPFVYTAPSGFLPLNTYNI